MWRRLTFLLEYAMLWKEQISLLFPSMYEQSSEVYSCLVLCTSSGKKYFDKRCAEKRKMIELGLKR